jgi:predicted RNA binding protein YcfA (HicA-like mRNA interferase family)
MSKSRTFIQKLNQTPTPTDIRWGEVENELKRYGFRKTNGNGSRRRFYHSKSKVLVLIHEPHPQPTIKPYVVRILRDSLDEHFKRQEQDE